MSSWLFGFGLLLFGEVLLKAVESPGPEVLILVDPVDDEPEGFGVEGDDVVAAAALAADEAGTLQDLHVLGDGVEGDSERGGDLRDAGAATREAQDHVAPSRVGDGTEDRREIVHR